MLKVKKLSEFAIIPRRATALSAGFDLSSAYDVKVPAHGKAMIQTDLSMSIPHTYYGRIAPRSSLAWKNHIEVGAGVIDSDYRGNIGIVLFNHSNEDFIVKHGDRVAQLILVKISSITECLEVKVFDNTIRGMGGFGSTGK
jgi:dUTP pyrophosphatase